MVSSVTGRSSGRSEQVIGVDGKSHLLDGELAMVALSTTSQHQVTVVVLYLWMRDQQDFQL